MKLNLQPRDRRALVILAIGLVAYVVLSWTGIPTFGGLLGDEAEAAQKEALLKKYKQVIARKDRYTELIAQTRGQLEQSEARLIRAASPSLAAVEFQTVVEEAARKWSLDLNQRNVAMNAQPKEALTDITMTLSFGCPPQQLLGFLAELKQLPKAVRIQAMTINPVQTAHLMPKAGPFSKDLNVTMTLVAVMNIAASGGNHQ